MLWHGKPDFTLLAFGVSVVLGYENLFLDTLSQTIKFQKYNGCFWILFDPDHRF